MPSIMTTIPQSVLGSLSTFETYDSTRHIGTVFPDKTVQLSKLLDSEDSDQLLKDLATLVSHRGVVFFKDQDLTIDEQKVLVDRLGRLTGGPKDSGLHRHPLTPQNTELGREVVVISTEIIYPGEQRLGSHAWHSDTIFEPIPCSYAILKMHTLPATGGDTLWASSCEAYDKLSPAYKKFVEGLTALHDHTERIHTAAKSLSIDLADEPRGSPYNVGNEFFKATHPVVRTNPVTGYKGLYVHKGVTKKIIELSPDESDSVLEYLTAVITQNHDLQVRYKWSTNDVAIWDNRSTFHTGTLDCEGTRIGDRTVCVGEKPFFDPASKSRRETLGFKN